MRHSFLVVLAASAAYGKAIQPAKLALETESLALTENLTTIDPVTGGVSCGDCGTSYQACCIAFGIRGYPCGCHLQEGGSGTAGSGCGDCGTEYAACCIGKLACLPPFLTYAQPQRARVFTTA